MELLRLILSHLTAPFGALRQVGGGIRSTLGDMMADISVKRWLGMALRASWRYRPTRYLTVTLASMMSLWLVFFFLTVFDVFGLNTVQEGWRIGNLADYSKSNSIMQWAPTGWVFPNGEGYLLLGDASSRNANLDGHSISPSYFSTTTSVLEQYTPMISLPVAMHYRQLSHTWFIGGETNIRVDRFEAQVPVTMSPDCSESHGWLTKKTGVMGGKIVEVASNGHPLLWKTREVIIYTGGNEFKEMSITDEHIYECAIVAAKSGMTMRITYDNNLIRDPVTQKTYYNLVGIAN